MLHTVIVVDKEFLTADFEKPDDQAMTTMSVTVNSITVTQLLLVSFCYTVQVFQRYWY